MDQNCNKMGLAGGNQQKRCPMIEIWRLVFTVLIVLWHTMSLPWCTEQTQLFRSAYIGVEFFFILSGCLMARTIDRKSNLPCTELGRESRNFVLSKVKSFLPTYVFALILDILVGILLPVLNRDIQWTSYAYYIWDILCLRAAGLQGYSADTAVGASWYLSAMALAMMILYPVARKCGREFQSILAPLLAIFIYGWFSAVYGTIHFTLRFQNGVCLGLLRAIAGICLGAVCWSACEWLRKWEPGEKKQIRAPATIGELGMFAATFWIARRSGESQADFVCIFFLAVGIMISFSGCSYTAVLAEKCRVDWIAGFSLALYLNHVVWIRLLFRWKIPCSFTYQMAIFLVLSAVTAMVCVWTIDLVRQVVYHVNYKCREKKR